MSFSRPFQWYHSHANTILAGRYLLEDFIFIGVKRAFYINFTEHLTFLKRKRYTEHTLQKNYKIFVASSPINRQNNNSKILFKTASWNFQHSIVYSNNGSLLLITRFQLFLAFSLFLLKMSIWQGSTVSSYNLSLYGCWRGQFGSGCWEPPGED